MLTQNKKLVTYTKLKERETQTWLKYFTNLYDTQVSLGGALPFDEKIMTEISQEKVKADVGMAHYYDPVNQSMVPGWDLEYKNQILTQLIAMLADMKPTCKCMD